MAPEKGCLNIFRGWSILPVPPSRPLQLWAQELKLEVEESPQVTMAQPLGAA